MPHASSGRRDQPDDERYVGIPPQWTGDIDLIIPVLDKTFEIRQVAGRVPRSVILCSLAVTLTSF